MRMLHPGHIFNHERSLRPECNWFIKINLTIKDTTENESTPNNTFCFFLFSHQVVTCDRGEHTAHTSVLLWMRCCFPFRISDFFLSHLSKVFKSATTKNSYSHLVNLINIYSIFERTRTTTTSVHKNLCISICLSQVILMVSLTRFNYEKV